MPPDLEKVIPELSAICKKHSVAKLAVFGSATGESFDSHSSDYDFLVEFLPLPAGMRANAYFSLLEDLQALLNRPIDLIVDGAIDNPFFEESVRASEQQLYAA